MDPLELFGEDNAANLINQIRESHSAIISIEREEIEQQMAENKLKLAQTQTAVDVELVSKCNRLLQWCDPTHPKVKKAAATIEELSQTHANLEMFTALTTLVFNEEETIFVHALRSYLSLFDQYTDPEKQTQFFNLFDYGTLCAMPDLYCKSQLQALHGIYVRKQKQDQQRAGMISQYWSNTKCKRQLSLTVLGLISKYFTLYTDQILLELKEPDLRKRVINKIGSSSEKVEALILNTITCFAADNAVHHNAGVNALEETKILEKLSNLEHTFKASHTIRWEILRVLLWLKECFEFVSEADVKYLLSIVKWLSPELEDLEDLEYLFDVVGYIMTVDSRWNDEDLAEDNVTTLVKNGFGVPFFELLFRILNATELSDDGVAAVEALFRFVNEEHIESIVNDLIECQTQFQQNNTVCTEYENRVRTVFNVAREKLNDRNVGSATIDLLNVV